MHAHSLVRPSVPGGVKGILAALTVLGTAGVVTSTMLGFEQPNTAMLVVSGAMMLTAPIAALTHLGVTSGLTQDEKRIWLSEFGSAGVCSALSEYLSSTDLSESAKRRAQDARARRRSN